MNKHNVVKGTLDQESEAHILVWCLPHVALDPLLHILGPQFYHLQNESLDYKIP